MPDVTFILDLDVTTAMDRIGENRDRMESRGFKYFEQVRAGFLVEAERWPDGVEVIDASRPAAEIQTKIRELADGYLRRKSPDKT
jgi:thymidylate kinase